MSKSPKAGGYSILDEKTDSDDAKSSNKSQETILERLNSTDSKGKDGGGLQIKLEKNQFRDFDDPEQLNAAEALHMVQGQSGNIDISYSRSKSSKAIDDLIDFKPPKVPEINMPTRLNRKTMDPLDYSKLHKSEPQPIVISADNFMSIGKSPEEIAAEKQKEMEENPLIERPPLAMQQKDGGGTTKSGSSRKQKSEDDQGSSGQKESSNLSKSGVGKMTKKETQPKIIINVDNLEDKEEDADQEEKKEGSGEQVARPKFLELCMKGEWGVVEQLLRSYGKDNPLPHMKDPETGETPLMLACKENRLVIVDRLLEMGVAVNETSNDGRTALHYAGKFSKEDIIKSLLAKKADANIVGSSKKNLPIHVACSRTISSPGIVSSILKATKNGRLQTDKEGSIPLMYAIEAGSMMTIKELLDKEAEAQAKTKKKHTGDAPIHVACRKKDLEALRLLAEAESPLNIQNSEGQTALHICSEEGEENLVKYLYTLKANANILDNMDRSPLHMAAEKGHTKIVEFLIDKFRCNVLTRDKEGNTLMHVTSLCGHPDTTMSFLRRGVPLHMPNKAGSVCLHAAAQRGHVNVVKSLLDKGANVNARTKDLYTPLHVAVKYGNPGVVETLIGYGAEVNVKGGLLDESPLHIAASLKGGENCADMLLKSGANVNDKMKKGETALHIAARSGNLGMLRSLLNEGADPAVASIDGNTALHIAVRYCHYDVTNELISFISRTKSRMDVVLLVNMPNHEGETALHLAAELEKKRAHSEFEDTDIMKVLLQYDGDMSIPTKFTHETPLHYCATAGNSDILLEIVNHLDHKIQYAVNKQAKNGWSPLLFASENGHHTIVQILLKNNARVDVFDEHGMTALHLAAEKGHVNVAEVLLKHKAFVNAKSKGGLTPLHLAAQNGYKELVEMLVKKYHASIDAVTLNRKTPLHLAAQYGKKEVCELLLLDKHNVVDPNAQDSKCQTPLHLAAKNDHSDVVKLFLKHKPELLTRANFDSDGMTFAHIAAANGSLSVIKEFMRFNKSAIHSVKNKATGASPLHLAAEGGHYKVVKVLLDAGASPSEENNEGMTCLHLAAKYGHIKLLHTLKSKISLKLVSQKTGMTALHVAAHYGQIEMVREMIVDVPANIKSDRPKTGEQLKDLLTESGLTPLHLAAQSGHENLVRLLLNCSGVEVDSATTNNGTIPLHFAAQNGHTNVTSLLLSKLASQIVKKDSKGRTSLHLAASHGHLEMAALLIGQGAEINATDSLKFTPLHFAAKSGYLKVCRLLVESGAACDMETSDFKIPLIFAAHFNHTDVLSFLFRHKHSTHKLMEDSKFLYDLMICSKLNNFKSMEEFVLLSPAPAETAAKLSQKFRLLSEKEKERSKDLLIVADYCENMCTDLVALAAVDKGADKLLKSLDGRGVQFLDVLIETQQKEVISHPSVQRYLSDIWMGNINWPTWKLLLLLFFFLIMPLSWLAPLIPRFKRFYRSPMIKFFTYLIAHVYLTIILMVVSILETNPFTRVTPDPSIIEWILLVCLSGQLVSELINPADRSGIGMLKLLILFFAAGAIITHIASIFDPTPDKMPEYIYIRNQILSFATFFCFVVTLDFLSIHHLFGPWTIIIRDLMGDLIRFLVILVIFIFGFSCMLLASYNPIREPQSTDTRFNVFDVLVMLYFSLYGLVSPDDLPKPSLSPSYAPTIAKIVFALFLLINIIVLINLLIAMMSDTYQRIQAQSDIEWKFGRAKLIRNMKKTTPIPSPFILISQFIYYVKIIYFKIRNLPIPSSVEEDFDDRANESGNGATHSLRRKSQVSPGIMETADLLDNGPERVEDVVDWPTIVRRYLAIRSIEGGMVSLEDQFEDAREPVVNPGSSGGTGNSGLAVNESDGGES